MNATLETEIEEKTEFTFDELSKQAQARAVRDFDNVHDNWWEYTYEDAEHIGLKITEFDTDRNNYAKGEFTGDEYGMDCARAIMANHGKDCASYIAAVAYLADAVLREAIWDDSKAGDWCEEHDAAERAEEFLKSVLEYYARVLQSEQEYLYSDAAIIETIKANDYTFDEDGNIV